MDIPCACGCGELVRNVPDYLAELPWFAQGHDTRIPIPTEFIEPNLERRVCHRCGKNREACKCPHPDSALCLDCSGKRKFKISPKSEPRIRLTKEKK